MLRSQIIIKYLLFSALLIIVACSSSNKREYKNADEVFQDAMKSFVEKEYVEAKKLFEVIKLQYPASQYADDAQYHLAEIEYINEKYIIAAFNYNMVRRTYPSSEFSKPSMFKAADCYYNLSPRYDRDQDYTQKAIDMLKDFRRAFPQDSLAGEAEKRVLDLRSKLAKREIFTAELYIKMNNPRASLVYFDTVISQYSDTEYFEQAFAGKIRTLSFLRRYEEATGLLELYRSKFPDGKFKSEINEIESTITEKVSEN